MKNSTLSCRAGSLTMRSGLSRSLSSSAMFRASPLVSFVLQGDLRETEPAAHERDRGVLLNLHDILITELRLLAIAQGDVDFALLEPDSRQAVTRIVGDFKSELVERLQGLFQVAGFEEQVGCFAERIALVDRLLAADRRQAPLVGRLAQAACAFIREARLVLEALPFARNQAGCPPRIAERRPPVRGRGRPRRFSRRPALYAPTDRMRSKPIGYSLPSRTGCAPRSRGAPCCPMTRPAAK